MASAAADSWHQGGPDSDLDMLATEFVWCPGDERMCKFPLSSPLSFPLLLISLFWLPSFPSMWTPKGSGPAQSSRQPGELEQLAWSRPCQGRTDANPVAST